MYCNYRYSGKKKENTLFCMQICLMSSKIRSQMRRKNFLHLSLSVLVNHAFPRREIFRSRIFRNIRIFSKCAGILDEQILTWTLFVIVHCFLFEMLYLRTSAPFSLHDIDMIKQCQYFVDFWTRQKHCANKVCIEPSSSLHYQESVFQSPFP